MSITPTKKPVETQRTSSLVLPRVGVGAFGLALEAWHLGEEFGGVTPERGPVNRNRAALTAMLTEELASLRWSRR